MLPGKGVIAGRCVRVAMLASILASMTLSQGEPHMPPTISSSASAVAAPTDLIISEYVEGSSLNKAIELFNGTGAPIDLGVYTVEIFFNANETAGNTINLSGTLADGETFVIADDGADQAILDVTDLAASGNFFNGNDSVVLRGPGGIVDNLGQIGDAAEFGEDVTLRRKPGVTDGDTDPNDAFDPSAEYAAFPQNAFDGLGTHAILGGVTGPVLSIAATDADRDEGDAGTTPFTFTVTRTGDDMVAASVDFAVSGDADAADFGGTLPSGTVQFAAGETEKTITLDVSGDDEGEGDEGFDVTLSGAIGASVGTASASGIIRNDDAFGATLISAIQGAGDVSPLAGQTVTVRAVVVGDFQDSAGADGDLNGFFLQEEDADADGDAATSEGLFVFDPDTTFDVQKGDLVEVTGTVAEFFGETQLGSVTNVTVIESGRGDLVSPAEIAFPVAGTRLNGDDELIADLEAFEGMLVTIPQELSVAQLFGFGRFGEVGLSAGGRLPVFTQTNAPDDDGAALAAYEDLAVRNTVFLDDGRAAQNPEVIPFEAGDGGLVADQYDGADGFRSGDTVTDLTGVVRFGRGSGGSGDEIYRINPTEDVAFENANPRENTPPEVGGRLKVASLNVLNYFTTIDDSESRNGTPTTDAGTEPRGANDLTDAPSFVAPSTQAANDPLAEFDRQEDKIVSQIAALDADVLGLVELENSGTDAALRALVDAINTSGQTTRTYDYVATGLVGTDAITTGFIYDTATVSLVGDAAILDDAGFTDPNATGAQRNRPAVAQTFEEVASGEQFTAAVNHFKSKGSSGLDAGEAGNPDSDQGDGQAFWNDTRTDAAVALAEWLATDPTGAGDPDTLILGDLNAYLMEDPITALRDAGYTDLAQEFGAGFQYSFAFPISLDTSSTVLAFGTLDYALANAAMLSQVTGAAEWHINADEPNAADYNLEFRPQGQADLFYTDGPARASDHDPILVGLDLDSAPTFNVIAGTPGNDDFQGTDARDSVAGEDGDDRLRGNAGDDVIEGGRGADTIFGGTGDDLVAADRTDRTADAFGGGRIKGGAGDDTVLGGSQDDRLEGGRDDDMLFAFGGDDIVFGGKGDDLIQGGEGNDDLRGQEGTDTLDYSDLAFAGVFGSVAGLDVNLRAREALHSGVNAALSFRDEVSGFETVIGTSRNDRFVGNRQDQVLVGGDEVGRADRATTFIDRGGEDYSVTGDVVEYFGDREEYAFVELAPGVVQSISDRDGVDTLIGFEFVRFDREDATVAIDDLFGIA